MYRPEDTRTEDMTASSEWPELPTSGADTETISPACANDIEQTDADSWIDADIRTERQIMHRHTYTAKQTRTHFISFQYDSSRKQCISHGFEFQHLNLGNIAIPTISQHMLNLYNNTHIHIHTHTHTHHLRTHKRRGEAHRDTHKHKYKHRHNTNTKAAHTHDARLHTDRYNG